MKLKEGDIFEFSISDSSKCYGQIVSTFKKDSYAIIVFEGLYRSKPDKQEILNDKILFFGNTFDAKFYHKDWEVIDSEISNLKNVKLPYYKIGTDPVYIENFFEKRIRKATVDEEDILNYRSYIAPVRFESAMKAHYTLLEWNDVYNEMLYTNVLKSIDLVENVDTTKAKKGWW